MSIKNSEYHAFLIISEINWVTNVCVLHRLSQSLHGASAPPASLILAMLTFLQFLWFVEESTDSRLLDQLQEILKAL